MRIVVANKFWYERGGLERVMFAEIDELQRHGHEVAAFSAAHPENCASEWSKYFADYLELGAPSRLSNRNRMLAMSRMFWNRQAAERFTELCDAFRPDLLHVHGIHRQLSPSLLSVARSRSIPVVQTLHDCHHVCPADLLLYRGVEPCVPQRCRPMWYGPAIAGRCVRGSLAASVVSATETWYQRVSRAYESAVARFIAPSEFIATRMRSGGWTIPIDLVPNPASIPDRVAPVGSRFVVVGRLVPEKGVDVALEAGRIAGALVVVVGDGPAREALEAEYPEALFFGQCSHRRVMDVIDDSRAVLLTSRVPENAPMSVLEAMSRGRAVIGTRVGGVPELVRDGVNGLLVSVGDAEELARAMLLLSCDPRLAEEMGRRGREQVVLTNSLERHMDLLYRSFHAAGAPS